MADPIGILQRAFAYLDIELSDRLTRTIVARNRFERLTIGRKIWQRPRRQGEADPGSHYRKGIIGDWRNYLSAEHIARLKELAGNELIELGYEKDLDW